MAWLSVVAKSQAGVLDCHVTTGTVDADVFDRYISDSLSTVVQAFDGVSVVVLDNASIHHVDQALKKHRCNGAFPSAILPRFEPS